MIAGDTGNVIDAKTRAVVMDLPALHNSRKHIEIDWQDGKIAWAQSNR